MDSTIKDYAAKRWNDRWNIPYLLLGGPLLVHWIWVSRSASLTSLNFSSCRQTHSQPKRTCGHMQDWRKKEKEKWTYPEKIFELNFRAVLKLFLNLLLIGYVQVDWIDPLQQHRFLWCTQTNMPAACCSPHLLRVIWEDRYYNRICSLEINLEPVDKSDSIQEVTAQSQSDIHPTVNL